jgi:hypothetical protein
MLITTCVREIVSGKKGTKEGGRMFLVRLGTRRLCAEHQLNISSADGRRLKPYFIFHFRCFYSFLSCFLLDYLPSSFVSSCHRLSFMYCVNFFCPIPSFCSPSDVSHLAVSQRHILQGLPKHNRRYSLWKRHFYCLIQWKPCYVHDRQQVRF